MRSTLGPVKLTTVLLAGFLATAVPGESATSITFEGVPDKTPVGDYYNGGAGGSLGVSFNKRFQAIMTADNGGTVAAISGGSGSSAIINIPAGFEASLSLLYSGPGNTVVLFDRPDAKGTQLSQTTLSATAPNSGLSPATIRFSGKARSILFGFVGFGARKTVVDNLEFGASR